MPRREDHRTRDAAHFKGAVTVRVGPATMSFKGTVEVLGLDTAQRTLHLVGKGADTTGTSGASMDLVAAVRTAGAACELSGRSEVAMSGKAAAFGGRVMTTVADEILKQFAANFAAHVQSVNAPQAAFEPSAPPGRDTATDSPTDAPTAPRTAAANLNGLALAWAVLRNWLRGLFLARHGLSATRPPCPPTACATCWACNRRSTGMATSPSATSRPRSC